MRTASKLMAGVALVWLAVAAQANEPHIGYVYPAGGQQGSQFSASIGGQYLKGSTNVFVSGEGVSVAIGKQTIKYAPKRIQQFYNRKKNLEGSKEDKEGEALEKVNKQIAEIDRQLLMAELPAGVDPLNKKEFQRYLRADTKDQFNPQISDRLQVTLTIADDAPPGERELRVYTPAGLSNPIYFQVGALEETLEAEPNDDHMSPDLQDVPNPSVINGQVSPGDIDHFRFKAAKGDSIVVDVSARRIIPYLADAVPGWFQAVVALYDEEGHEVAYQDDYKFNPDPVLFFDVPEAGTYTLSIRDSIYRGREDFIYRIALGELPFITGIFPLGAQQGKAVDIALMGKNLPKNRLNGKLPNNGFEVRHLSVKNDGYRSNLVPFAISEMAEVLEVEPNNTEAEAQAITEPIVVNGRIQQPGDRDVFSVAGKKGDSISIEVIARRLNSPVDSVITLSGPGLDKPVRNDDYVNKDVHLHLGAGLVTHHADSYLLHELPETGTYFVEIGDTQSKGGNDYSYRLRISPSNPDFKLRMEPSGLHIAPGGTVAFSVRAQRLDGFDQEIKISSANLPVGFEMSNTVVPAGSDITRFTITAPREIKGALVNPEITGAAMINGKEVIRPAIPVDNQMQAFLYRHLVPAQELVLAPVAQRSTVVFEARLPKSGVIELPLGKEVWIPHTGKVFGGSRGFALSLDNPPEGITVKKGWFSKKKLKEKTKSGKDKFEKNIAAGSILLVAEEPLKPGDTLSLVVVAEVRKGKEKIKVAAPAITVKIVKPVSK